MLQFTFKNSTKESEFLKIPGQAFEAANFLNIFLSFWGFWALFSYKNFYKKTGIVLFRSNQIADIKFVNFKCIYWKANENDKHVVP